MPEARPGYVVVGGGLVGLATAYQLLRLRPGCGVTVLEKEREVCTHQSGRNSGVLHAGLAYKPGSSKALLVTKGVEQMKAFCRDNGIVFDICGKLIVATTSAELDSLERLRAQGAANGLKGLRLLSVDEAREREPSVGGIGALLVPEEGIVDYAGVGRALLRHISELGGVVRTGSAVSSIATTGAGWMLSTSTGDVPASYLINCAGLYSDRICRMTGERPSVRIVPFRGEYYRLRPGRAALVRGLIYPVADPSFPFLGVHLTRRVDGNVDAGPNAVLALAREGYDWTTVKPRDAFEALSYAGLWRFIAKHPVQSASEVHRSLRKSAFVSALQALVPSLREDDLVPGVAGVRAQAMGRDGSLVQDFAFHQAAHALHVLNAPSPAATASLAIGSRVARSALGLPTLD